MVTQPRWVPIQRPREPRSQTSQVLARQRNKAPAVGVPANVRPAGRRPLTDLAAGGVARAVKTPTRRHGRCEKTPTLQNAPTPFYTLLEGVSLISPEYERNPNGWSGASKQEGCLHSKPYKQLYTA